jgi:hypothetical protein
MIAEIVTVEATKSKAGARAVKVVIKKTDGVWIRDYIGENAPDFVIERYWNLLDRKRDWAAFVSLEVFDLMGLVVEVKTKEGNYGEDVVDIRLAGTEPSANMALDDDIPF